MKPSFDHWTIIFLVVALQGLLLAVGIYQRKRRETRYLACLVTTFSLIMVYYVIYWTGYFRTLPRAIAVLQGLTYCLGPFFFHYVKQKKRISYGHWVPFIAYVIYFFTLPYLIVDVRPKVFQTQVVLQVTHLIAYAILSLIHLADRSDRLKTIAWCYLGYTLSFLAYFIMVWTRTLTLEYDYMVSFAASFFIYFVGYSAFFDTSILHSKQPRYYKSGLSESAAIALHRELIQMMETDKPYLESELKLTDLSASLSQSPNHLSQIINELEGCNFSEFINRYRVEESKRLLQHQNDVTLIQIAYRAGFNNKVTFNNTFKKFTGFLPSEFRNILVRQ
jgi:AraC-like DNA-binding protein